MEPAIPSDSTTIAWIQLLVAGLLEVCWAVGLKYTEGFSRLWPSVGTGVALVLSMYLLSRATAVLPIGTAYAIWVGIGALGAAVLGVVLFGESASPARMAFLMLLLASIVGLKITAH